MNRRHRSKDAHAKTNEDRQSDGRKRPLSRALTAHTQEGWFSPHTHSLSHTQAFASKQGLERGKLRFMFDGVRIGEDATALDLELEDDDLIDAFLHQVGGAP